MRRYEHVHRVGRPPAAVWAALVDLERWSAWSTLTATAPEGLIAGAPLKLVLRVGGRALPVTATLTEVAPGEALVWRGGPRALFQAEHGFRLRAVEGGTEISHFETFEGPLVRPILALLGARHPETYGVVNRRLAAVCEGAASATLGP